MKLRITSPESDGQHYVAGYLASTFLDGVDVSRYVNKVVLTVDDEGVISAEVRVFLSEVDVDVAALIVASLLEAPEAVR